MTKTPDIPAGKPNHPLHQARTARLTLAAFLVLSILLAVGVVVFRGRLHTLEQSLLAAISREVGVQIAVDSLRLNGLHGITLVNAHATYAPDNQSKITLTAPSLRIQVDLADLLQGRVTLGRIHLEGAVIEVHDASQWLQRIPKKDTNPSQAPRPPLLLPEPPKIPFRLSGAHCAIRLQDIIEGQSILLEDIGFDVFRPVDAADLTGRVAFTLQAARPHAVSAVLRFASWEDFEIKLNADPVSLDEIAAFAPDARNLLASGAVGASLTVTGQPGQHMLTTVNATFQELALTKQPEFLPPLNGQLRAIALFNTQTLDLSINEMTLATAEIDARGHGAIHLADPSPTFDLTLSTDKLPVDAAIKYYLPLLTEDLGKASIALNPPYKAQARLEGALKSPKISTEVTLSAAVLSLEPKDTRFPGGKITLGPVQIAWDSDSRLPSGSLLITDGGLSKPWKGMALSQLAANAVLDKGVLHLDPFSADLNGRPLMGQAAYDLANRTLDVAMNASITEMEKTPLHYLTDKLWLYGDVTARCAAKITPKRIEAEASADATQAKIDFEWWLRKPKGTGAVIHSIKAVMLPGKTMQIRGEASVDATPINAVLDYVWGDGKWNNEHVRVNIPGLDINSAGKCINIPYTATGGKVRDGFYEWTKSGNRQGGHIATLGGVFDDVSLLPQGCPAPLHCTNAQVNVTLDNTLKDIQPKHFVIHAEQANVPSLEYKWLLPMGKITDHEYVEKDPSPPSTTTYTLSADAIEMLPWKGSAFKGEVFDNDMETGLSHFEAVVDGGKIAGEYKSVKTSNEMRLNATWDNIPAIYLIRHIKLPEVLDGRVSGFVDYTMDVDDPNTMTGKGRFDMPKGQFIPEELEARFGEAFFGNMRELHPSALTFSKFHADIGLEGDHILTKNVLIDMEGMTLRGDGTWITDGDIDYNLTLSITPETAAQIPIMRESFNLEGYRITQRNIDLGFKIQGPAFKPTSELAGLPPVGVTLVSGAAEMTSETVRIMDLPRQLLMSVFKAGGGILGATTRQQAPPSDKSKKK